MVPPDYVLKGTPYDSRGKRFQERHPEFCPQNAHLPISRLLSRVARCVSKRGKRSSPNTITIDAKTSSSGCRRRLASAATAPPTASAISLPPNRAPLSSGNFAASDNRSHRILHSGLCTWMGQVLSPQNRFRRLICLMQRILRASLC